MKKKSIILALILIGAFVLMSCKTGKESETQNTDDAGVVTQVYASEFAKQLYALKNPYIGNASADGLLISELHEYYQIENSYTTELQTTEAPFWITIRFYDKPDEEKMCKVAALFIALTDNCDEFRWSYAGIDGTTNTAIITSDAICEALKISDLKNYGQSGETLQELLYLLEGKTIIPESLPESEPELIGKELSNVIMAKASVDFGKHKGYSINLLMKDGRYYTEAETVPGVGTYAENYDGNYVLQVIDLSGQLLDELSLKEDNPDWGHSTINFPGKFELCISDYNGDELPDFTIGTAGSSGMNVFELYTVNEEGRIENISTGFANTSKEFSIFLEETSNGFQTRTWNNAIGEEEIEYFEWNPGEGKFLPKDIIE